MIAISWICLKKTVLPLSRSLFSVKWLHLLQRPSCLYFELKVWISGQQKPRETEGDAKETVSAAELINMVWRYTQRSKVLWLFHCSCFISGCLVWNCFVTNCIFTWNCTYNVRLSCNASFRCHSLWLLSSGLLKSNIIIFGCERLLGHRKEDRGERRHRGWGGISLIKLKSLDH